MSVLKANCPSCAAPIEFKTGSSLVVVCPYCRSAIARTDRKLEDLGKIAEVSSSQSPLELGLRGDYKGHVFELTGRAQLQHQAGGAWDEWYATFSNGWVGWLAEAQGKFYMTFYKPIAETVALPGFDSLSIGQEITQITSKTPLIVVEKGTATYAAADGEIPYILVPGERSNYADLTGKGNTFATIDYSKQPPYVFFGEEVTLKDLGLAERRAAKREAKEVDTEAMSCPNCGGTLELKAPDTTERVTCPYCNSLLDVNEGNLTYLSSLEKLDYEKTFAIPIGTKFTSEAFAAGTGLEVIGSMIRSVAIEGTKYYWQEFLLYNAKVGYRWLINSDYHWSFGEPVNVADVEVSNSEFNRNVRFHNQNYKIFQVAPAFVEYVCGEFYWRVTVGEAVETADYVAPPYMLSRELNEREVSWTLSTYIPLKDFEKATGIGSLPKPGNVAPNQPFTGGSLIKYGFALVGVLVIFGIFLIPFTGISKTALSEDFVLQPLTTANGSRTFETQEFELKGAKNISITFASNVSNSWAEYSADLIQNKGNDIESVTVPVEFYSGVTDGEAWSEGGKSSYATISSVPAGKYKLRVEGSWEKYTSPMPVRVTVEQGVTRGVNFWLAFIVLLIVPTIALLRKLTFEGRRWNESMFGSS